MDRWPPLPLEEWAGTRWTLHRYCQVVGKIRMALAPYRNHWWHATLYVSTTGLTTGPMPLPGGRTAEIAFDFVNHRLVLIDSDGRTAGFALRDGLACGTFYSQLFEALEGMGVDVAINPAAYDLEGPPLSEDAEHDRYDPDAVTRFWTILRNTAGVLERFAGRFNGKQSPVQLFWHSFDLAQARYSGRPAPVRPEANAVTREAYSHEVIAFGFWPGDKNTPYPAFYSYTAPAPAGLTAQPLSPEAAWWQEEAGSAYLRYDDVRTGNNPEQTLLDFFESAYRAGAVTAGWGVEAFESKGPEKT